MKWQGGRRGGNIEDRRGMSSGGKVALGGAGGIIVLLLSLFFGGDPSQILGQLGGLESGVTNNQPYESTPEEDRLLDFADVVLTSTDDVWTKLFADAGQGYPKPKMVVYTEGTATEGCGYGHAHFGPFYCPADQSIYLDLSFNRELKTKFGAEGEFALAYVIAHEVGHHIQNILGVLEQTNAMRSKLSERENNKISVMTELQADFYAGVWAHHVNRSTNVILTYEDIVEGMRAAAAVGDDHIQEMSQGRANPETFTHGTSEQRAYWFKKGYDSGDLMAGNTFKDPSLN